MFLCVCACVHASERGSACVCVCLCACVRDGWNDLCLGEFVIKFSRVVCFYVSVTNRKWNYMFAHRTSFTSVHKLLRNSYELRD